MTTQSVKHLTKNKRKCCAIQVNVPQLESRKFTADWGSSSWTTMLSLNRAADSTTTADLTLGGRSFTFEVRLLIKSPSFPLCEQNEYDLTTVKVSNFYNKCVFFHIC